MATKKINVVVAACNGDGIGINGQLPWRIKGDMAFFKTITSETGNSDKRNAVIMGRKTWDSIPKKFRPLANRVNIVISKSLQKDSLPADVHVANSWDKAIDILSMPEVAELVENVFVIGGSSIYKMAFESPLCHRIYLTRVLEEFNCDTHLPEFDKSRFEKVSDPKVDSEERKENDISYKFEVYQKL